MKRYSFLCSVALITLGCSHDKAPDAAPTASVAAAAPAVSVAPDLPASAASVAATDSAVPAPTPVAPSVVAKIPAEEDFEPQAATTITAANASQQLALIEKEIAK